MAEQLAAGAAPDATWCHAGEAPPAVARPPKTTSTFPSSWPGAATVIGTGWQAAQETALRKGPDRRWDWCAPTATLVVAVSPLTARGGAALPALPWQPVQAAAADADAPDGPPAPDLPPQAEAASSATAAARRGTGRQRMRTSSETVGPPPASGDEQ